MGDGRATGTGNRSPLTGGVCEPSIEDEWLNQPGGERASAERHPLLGDGGARTITDGMPWHLLRGESGESRGRWVVGCLTRDFVGSRRRRGGQGARGLIGAASCVAMLQSRELGWPRDKTLNALEAKSRVGLRQELEWSRDENPGSRRGTAALWLNRDGRVRRFRLGRAV